MNLKMDSSTVVFSCESCEIFKNPYFVEHQRTVVSAIDIDTKYSLRSIDQHIYKQCWKTRLSVKTDMIAKGIGLANFEGQ